MWETIFYAFLFFFQNSYWEAFLLVLFCWLLRALLGKYLLNYRYSYMHFYGKAVEYLIKDCHINNYDTTISTLAKISIKHFQYYHYFVVLLLQILDEGIS